MTDDIVFRLRATLAHADDVYDTMNQAADEIERLQKLLTTWIICAERLVESNEGEAYQKALAFYIDCQRISKETC